MSKIERRRLKPITMGAQGWKVSSGAAELILLIDLAIMIFIYINLHQTLKTCHTGQVQGYSRGLR